MPPVSAQVAEVIAPQQRRRCCRSTAAGATPIAALDVVLDKLERQIVRTKERPRSVRKRHSDEISSHCCSARRSEPSTLTVPTDPGGPDRRQDETVRHAADVRGGRHRADGGAGARLLRLPRRRDRRGRRPLPPCRWQLRLIQPVIGRSNGDRAEARSAASEQRRQDQQRRDDPIRATKKTTRPTPQVRSSGAGQRHRLRLRSVTAVASSDMARTVARPEAAPAPELAGRTRPAVGMHLGVGHGPPAGGSPLAPDRRDVRSRSSRDNPAAWRRRPEPPLEAPDFIDYGAREGLRDDRDPRVVPHQPRRVGRAIRVAVTRRAHRRDATGALLRRDAGEHPHRLASRSSAAGPAWLASSRAWRAVLAESPPGVRLVLENSSGGGDLLGSAPRAAGSHPRWRGSRPTGSASASTPRTCGAPGYDISDVDGATAWSIGSKS